MENADGQDKLRKLEDEIIQARGELVLKEATIEELQHGLVFQEEKIEELKRQIAEMSLQMKIVHDSVTFKFMQKCSPVIDRCFPPGTWRVVFVL